MFEHDDFLFGEFAPVTARDVFLGQTTIIYTVEFFDIIFEMLKNTPNNAITPNVYFYADASWVIVLQILDFIDHDWSIFEFETFSDGLQMCFFYGFIERDVVYFSDSVAWVHELIGECAVIGE